MTTIHFRKALPRSADLIFVLVGRDYRKHYGLQLFKLGLAPRLLRMGLCWLIDEVVRADFGNPRPSLVHFRARRD